MCPNSCNMLQFPLLCMNLDSAPSSASVTEDITALMISDTVRMTPLLGGKGWFFDR